MKRSGFILAILLCIGSLDAQERFYNLVDGWINNISFENEEGYSLIGLDVIGSPVEHQYFVNHIDFEGAVVGELTYFVDSVETTSIWALSSSSALDLDSVLYISSRGYYKKCVKIEIE